MPRRLSSPNPLSASGTNQYAPAVNLSAFGAAWSPLPALGCLWRADDTSRVPFIFLIGALLALALPAEAGAKAGYRVDPGGTELILPVHANGGRVISVSADSLQRVLLKVERPSSTIEYSTQGRVSRRRIKADFGALGRVDVRLDLARFGPGVLRREHCNGHDPIEGIGTYRGMIEFSQEGGVPEVSVARGRAHFERRFRQVCKRRQPQPKPGLYPKLERKEEEGLLTVRGKGEGRTVRLWATIIAFRRHPAYSGGWWRVAVSERREGVRITRATGSYFYHNRFIMSRRGKEPETVEVESPKHFSGRALYSQSPGSTPSWTGDLSVDLPGAEGVRLAGPEFSADLCRGKLHSCPY
jgi:hypothetical protein